MNVEIVRFSPEQLDNVFYSEMGRFFATRDYMVEMGGWQFYNKPNTYWWVASLTGTICGFSSAEIKSTHIWWDNFFVLPAFRSKGISKLIHDHRMRFSTQHFNKEIRCITNNPIQIINYERIGMIHYGNRGRYKKFKLEVL